MRVTHVVSVALVAQTQWEELNTALGAFASDQVKRMQLWNWLAAGVAPVSKTALLPAIRISRRASRGGYHPTLVA
jgi:hypothetical protein